jgi:hypothetical protein
VNEYLYFPLFILNKFLPLTSSLETAEDFCQTNAESIFVKISVPAAILHAAGGESQTPIMEQNSKKKCNFKFLF